MTDQEETLLEPTEEIEENSEIEDKNMDPKLDRILKKMNSQISMN